MALKVKAVKGNLTLNNGYLFASEVRVSKAKQSSEDVAKTKWHVTFALLASEEDRKFFYGNQQALATKTITVEAPMDGYSVKKAYEALGPEIGGWEITVLARTV